MLVVAPAGICRVVPTAFADATARIPTSKAYASSSLRLPSDIMVSLRWTIPTTFANPAMAARALPGSETTRLQTGEAGGGTERAPVTGCAVRRHPLERKTLDPCAIGYKSRNLDSDRQN